jgi:exopolysaccharide biosynthesis WecB/TagA/CpsF family protein
LTFPILGALDTSMQSNKTGIELIGVKVLPSTKKSLLNQIENLKPKQKMGLVAFYSEFFLMGLRNKNYQVCLNAKNNLQIIDGHGAFWALWENFQGQKLGLIYQKYFRKLPSLLRIISFKILFFLALIWNFVTGFWFLTISKNSKKLQKQGFFADYEVVLGRNLVYDLLKLAGKKKWQVSLILGSRDTKLLEKNLAKLIDLDLVRIHSFSPESELMRDQTEFSKDKSHSNINHLISSQNILEAFPDLKKTFVQLNQSEPDLILLFLGGGSGKQEFFAQYLKENLDSFRLVAGLGAALDHLGAGNQQKPSPRWLTEMGLEWLYRLLVVPNRRLRVIKTILNFWYYTTLDGFKTLN